MKLVVQQVEKKIARRPILRSITCELPAGQVIGIYGANGSGKTMFLRALAKLMPVTKGEVIFVSDDKPRYGVLIDQPQFWPDYTGFATLKLLAHIRNLITEKDILAAVERVQLGERIHDEVRSYSLGMKQKLAIAQAIMERPNILLLDEPTNGLDDEALQALRVIVQEEAARGAIVVVASHYKEWLSETAHTLLEMREGELYVRS